MPIVGIGFGQTFDKYTLEYILIMYPVGSKLLVRQCFGVFHRRFVRRLVEWHHVGVCFCGYIVRCVRIKQGAGSLALEMYSAFHLTLKRLLFQCNACVERGGSGAHNGEVLQPKCGSLMYLIRITHQYKCMQKAENGDRVELIKYLGPLLHLLSLGPSSKASSYFVTIMS